MKMTDGFKTITHNVDVLVEETNNYQRLRAYCAVRLIPTEPWGNDTCHIFSFDVR